VEKLNSLNYGYTELNEAAVGSSYGDSKATEWANKRQLITKLKAGTITKQNEFKNKHKIPLPKMGFKKV
jgi:hypothetical protein